MIKDNAKKFDNLLNLDESLTSKVIYDVDKLKICIGDVENSYLIVKSNDKIGLLKNEEIVSSAQKTNLECIGFLPNFAADHFGAEGFREDYNVKYSYMAGAMAHNISSAKMVISLGKARILGSYGSGGIPVEDIEQNIIEIKKALPNGPFCFNLLNSIQEPAKEQKIIDLFLKYDINIIEASAFMILSQSLVQYRLKGLKRNSTGNIIIKNKIIAKISRDKVARRFMEPAPIKIVQKLLEQKLITDEEAELSRFIPMADDITAEGDSGGHTDNRPIISLFTVIKNLRNEIQEKFKYQKKVRVGIGGGISTPESMIAAFEMGADYVVTGSINQACIESATSDWAKKLLSEAEYTDVATVRAADMFELGAHVQVLTKGNLYSVRVNKLTELYEKYNTIEQIPQEDKLKVEQFFQNTLEKVWVETKNFFQKIHHEEMIKKAEQEPKKKMALIFRWYLGQSPNWARKSVMERKDDFQIWCGPAIGAFNDWVKNTDLSKPENRSVVNIADVLFKEAVILKKQNFLRDFFGILF
jgi:PfaD family protein